MIRILRANEADQRRALGLLAGRFSFTSFINGEMILPEAALPFLTDEGVSLIIRGADQMAITRRLSEPERI